MQLGEFFFDGDKKVIYEAPTVGFSYITDGDGYRIYTPDDEPSAPTQIEYTTYELWSRSVDFLEAIPWADLVFALSGGAWRYKDQFNEDKYSLIDIRFVNDWAYVPSNYPHSTFIKGNIFPNIATNITFDTSRITRQGVSPSIYFSDAGERSVADASALEAIAFMSFGNPAQVTVDVLHGHSIATFTGDQNLLGNAQYPVDNFPDAKTIATAKKIHYLDIVHSCTISVSDFSHFNITGVNHVNVTLTIEDAADVEGVKIDNISLQGTLDGGVDVHDSIIGDINYFNGHIHDSGLGGTITLGGAIESYIANCTRLVDEIVPEIDFNNENNHLVLANYTGVINFTNMTDPDANAMVGLNQGAIVLNSANCTAGTVTATGLGKIMDENGDCIPPGMWNGMLIQNSLMSNESITMNVWADENARKLLNENLHRAVISPDDLHVTIYEEDGVTISHERDISDDKRERFPI